MIDKPNGIRWLPPRDSNPDMLIQSQQVTLTGPVGEIKWLLESLRLDVEYFRLTVTITPTSVTDATVSVPSDSRQNSRQDGEA